MLSADASLPKATQSSGGSLARHAAGRCAMFIIGWDGGGNPFSIETTTGRVILEEPDFGGIHKLAPNLDHSC